MSSTHYFRYTWWLHSLWLLSWTTQYLEVVKNVVYMCGRNVRLQKGSLLLPKTMSCPSELAGFSDGWNGLDFKKTFGYGRNWSSLPVTTFRVILLYGDSKCKFRARMHNYWSGNCFVIHERHLGLLRFRVYRGICVHLRNQRVWWCCNHRLWTMYLSFLLSISVYLFLSHIPNTRWGPFSCGQASELPVYLVFFSFPWSARYLATFTKHSRWIMKYTWIPKFPDVLQSNNKIIFIYKQRGASVPPKLGNLNLWGQWG